MVTASAQSLNNRIAKLKDDCLHDWKKADDPDNEEDRHGINHYDIECKHCGLEDRKSEEDPWPQSIRDYLNDAAETLKALIELISARGQITFLCPFDRAEVSEKIREAIWSDWCDMMEKSNDG